jgi:hypothetical protein
MGEKKLNFIPVIDVSGSMETTAYSKYSCLDVATGLGLYFASNNHGVYKNKWVTFSENPRLEELKGSTLSERLEELNDNWWGG